MASPFPGMDPYLEQPAFWASFHRRLISGIADTIGPQLRPQYYVDIETRTYLDDEADDVLVGIPDALIFTRQTARQQPDREPERTSGTLVVASQTEAITLPLPQRIQERYLEIREIGSDEAITVLEVLSPKNKQAGLGREAYVRKRRAVLGSRTHLVEIDFLRAGKSMEWLGGTNKDYHIVISRSEWRPAAELCSFLIQDVIPTIALPLKGEQEALALDLQRIFTAVVERASYDLRIDYSQPLPPQSLGQRCKLGSQGYWLTQFDLG
jgi:hypothetical protein